MLGAGIFMGWSLGTNDAANAFGTAVATGVVKYRTAVTIIAIMVVLGAFLQGSLNLESVNKLAVTNAVIPSEDAARAQIEAGKKSVAYSLKFRAADRTLSDEDIDPALNKIFAKLKENDCILRS